MVYLPESVGSVTRTLAGLKLDSQNTGSTNVNIAPLHSNSSSDGFEHMIGKRAMLDDYNYCCLYENIEETFL